MNKIKELILSNFVGKLQEKDLEIIEHSDEYLSILAKNQFKIVLKREFPNKGILIEVFNDFKSHIFRVKTKDDESNFNELFLEALNKLE